MSATKAKPSGAVAAGMFVGGFFPWLSLLTLIFATAKVFGFSNMGWLLVFTPMLVVPGVIVGLLLVAAFLFVLVAVIAAIAK